MFVLLLMDVFKWKYFLLFFKALVGFSTMAISILVSVYSWSSQFVWLWNFIYERQPHLWGEGYVLVSLSTTAMSGLVASSMQSVWILKSYKTMTWSFSVNFSGLWLYNFSLALNSHFLYRQQWRWGVPSSWIHLWSFCKHSELLLLLLIFDLSIRSSYVSIYLDFFFIYTLRPWIKILKHVLE